MGTSSIKKVFELKPNLYREGSPVLIAAGDIIKNNNTDQIWARLKFQNIVDREISAVKVRLTLYDITETPISHADYEYLDLHVRRNSVFGAEKLISLPVSGARSFCVDSMEVFFADKSYKVIQGEWTPIFHWNSLANKFSVEEEEQYQRDTTVQAQYLVEEDSDLWLCTCGNINHQGEESCIACRQKKESLLAALDKAELNKRLEVYKAEQKAAQEAEVKAAANRRNRRNRIIAIVAAVALVVIGLVSYPSIYESIQEKMLIEKAQQAVAGKTFRGGDRGDYWYSFSVDKPTIVSWGMFSWGAGADPYKWDAVFVVEKEHNGELVVRVDGERLSTWGVITSKKKMSLEQERKVFVRFGNDGKAFLEVICNGKVSQAFEGGEYHC